MAATTVHSFAALEAKSRLTPFDFNPPELVEDQLEIKVTHCGICHSDIHMIDNDWGWSSYPLVAGHEIIGHVTAVGPRCRRYKPGDRVGLGWQAAACRECDLCFTGNEQQCPKGISTIVNHHGGYATHVRAQEHCVVRIPDSLPSETAAPLLCAGSTLYSPIREHVRAWHTVGVIGVGGLGHVGLQLARAFGAEVVAFSTSPDKEAEARKFGASKFVNLKDPEQVKAAAETIDVMLNTASGSVDTDQILKLLRTFGKLVLLGLPVGRSDFDTKVLLPKERTITSSLIASPKRTQEMLDFCARHKITCQTELYPIDRVNEALDHVRANKARYRVVLTQ